MRGRGSGGMGSYGRGSQGSTDGGIKGRGIGGIGFQENGGIDTNRIGSQGNGGRGTRVVGSQGNGSKVIGGRESQRNCSGGTNCTGVLGNRASDTLGISRGNSNIRIEGVKASSYGGRSQSIGTSSESMGCAQTGNIFDRGNTDTTNRSVGSRGRATNGIGSQGGTPSLQTPKSHHGSSSYLSFPQAMIEYDTRTPAPTFEGLLW